MSKIDLFKYISLLEEKCRFDFVDDDKIRDLLYKFSAYVLYISQDDINNSDENDLIELKTHTVTIYIGSIIEASLYYFINEKFKNDEKKKRKYLKINEFKSTQKIKLKDYDKEYHICELLKKEVSLNDTINFHALLNGARDNKIIDTDIIFKIDEIRKMRNNVHINVYKTGEKVKFYDLKKIFIDTKDILDYLEENL